MTDADKLAMYEAALREIADYVPRGYTVMHDSVAFAAVQRLARDAVKGAPFTPPTERQAQATPAKPF